MTRVPRAQRTPTILDLMGVYSQIWVDALLDSPSEFSSTPDELIENLSQWELTRDPGYLLPVATLNAEFMIYLLNNMNELQGKMRLEDDPRDHLQWELAYERLSECAALGNGLARVFKGIIGHQQTLALYQHAWETAQRVRGA